MKPTDVVSAFRRTVGPDVVSAFRTLGLMLLVLSIQTASTQTQAPSLGSAIAQCDQAAITRLGLDNVSITAVDRHAAGRFTPPGARVPFTELPAFCRVQARVTTSSDSTVNFDVWVPGTWNGKIVVTGNGGYSNVPAYRDMVYAMTQGFVPALWFVHNRGQDINKNNNK